MLQNMDQIFGLMARSGIKESRDKKRVSLETSFEIFRWRGIFSHHNGSQSSLDLLPEKHWEMKVVGVMLNISVYNMV
uniref:Uncharacterized protein n=1 Tax=Arion vulgaris TaxID=1028688 RepID=A0A0B6YSL9_9EUPU